MSNPGQSRAIANLPPRNTQVLCKLKGGGHMVAKRTTAKTVHFEWRVVNGSRMVPLAAVSAWTFIADVLDWKPFDPKIFEA